MSFDNWISPKAAGLILDVTPGRIQQLIREERLVTMMTPLGRLIDKQSVYAYLHARSCRGKARAA